MMVLAEWKATQSLPMSSQLISNVIPQQRVIKHGHLFLVDDLLGNIPQGNDAGLGLYASDTRFLSCFEVFLNGTQPVPLMTSTKAGDHSVIVYTNQEMEELGAGDSLHRIAKETVQLRRNSRLNSALFERFSLRNYNQQPYRFQVAFALGADFRDIFEVRHLVPSHPGRFEETQCLSDRIVFRYVDGLGDPYETHVVCQGFVPHWVPDVEGRGILMMETTLAPLERQTFGLRIEPVLPGRSRKTGDPETEFIQTYDSVEKQSQHEHDQWNQSITRLSSDNVDFNEMLNQSCDDIQMLITSTSGIHDQASDYIAAGIPWFVALFGRDSLITARDCLLIKPELARNVLKTLAHYQGTQINDWRDEEPGKILHELRLGELARLEKIPHTPYYGTVDATPLWLILLYDYFLWSQDLETVQTLWPNALRAMDWIDRRLADDPRGYLTYFRKSAKGLGNQNWKDSDDSAMHANGELATGPLAMVEVQGYVYQAKCRMAELALLLEDRPLAERLTQEAAQLKERFNRDYWVDDLGFYAMALDGDGKPLEVISSNPGHCLESGILEPDKAQRVAERLLQPDMFSGWGIRTLSAKTLRYNPMSYHNGSVWPHDNALIVRGLSAIGRRDLAERVFKGLYEAGCRIQYKRMPELFCGFDRITALHEPPVRYPSACSPQAWAASSVFALLQAMLNLTPTFNQSTLTIRQPMLPGWINHLQLSHLGIGESRMDLDIRRTHHGSVVIDIVNRHGKPFPVMIEKT